MFLVDWWFPAWRTWIDFGVATVLVFGSLAYRLQQDLRQAKCLLVFFGLIVLHCGVFLHLFHSGIQIRTAWYVPIVGVEALLFSLILTGPGGARSEEKNRG